MKNRLCHALAINTPIIHCPMHTMTNGKMVAAISEAGGLGILGINSGYNITDVTSGASSTNSEVVGNPNNYSILDTMTERNLMNEQINTTLENTFRSFAVEVASQYDSPEKDPTAKSIVELMRKRRLTIALFEGLGSPLSLAWAKILHENGIKIMQVVSDLAFANTAINHGLDIAIVKELVVANKIQNVYPDTLVVLASGIETSDIQTLIQQVDGIYLNTPFAICNEAIIDDGIKARFLSSHKDDFIKLTLPFGDFLTFKTPYIEQILSRKLSPQELFNQLHQFQGLIDGMIKGNLSYGYCLFDLNSYNINEALSAEEIINTTFHKID
ncbi:hypothetical protein ETI37_04135 [Lactobacillus mulieris]|uniref:nitronate monooxygenase n=1 Tax=Lactobacillus TaxID=1578 RepID=UPI001179B7B3|nr:MULTISPECIES: nitronate monooxygenase [Lactobacillus]TRT38396.1 hypothetical protein ETI26_03810 [Lactobacillus sp. c10Ua232AE]TRT41080.1 hypothetical protein ETI37_04135 [Lactobacillus mulieris]